jgi:hypothetical protein
LGDFSKAWDKDGWIKSLRVAYLHGAYCRDINPNEAQCLFFAFYLFSSVNEGKNNKTP